MSTRDALSGLRPQDLEVKPNEVNEQDWQALRAYICEHRTLNEIGQSQNVSGPTIAKHMRRATQWIVQHQADEPLVSIALSAMEMRVLQSVVMSRCGQQHVNGMGHRAALQHALDKITSALKELPEKESWASDDLWHSWHTLPFVWGNALARVGIRRLSVAQSMSDDELRSIRGIGFTGLKAIRSARIMGPEETAEQLSTSAR